MRKGFTILELLVASLLLGMLVTILTVMFNQSSIAWRTGVAGVADMDDIRNDVAEVREEADNLFVSGNQVGRITSLWDANGQLRTRAYSEDKQEIPKLDGRVKPDMKLSDITTIEVGGSKSKSRHTYTIGVTSSGPDGVIDTYDDITTWPDEIQW